MQSIGSSRLLDLWRSKCDGRDIPDRADFQPEEFAPWMGDLAICGVEHKPWRRFKLRLVGTNVRELDDRDYTGWYLDEAPNEPLRGHVIGQWALCVAKRRPVLVSYTSSPEAPAQLELDKLMLPLSTGADAVGQVLAHVVVRRTGTLVPRWPTLHDMEGDGSSSVVVIS